MCGLFGWTIAPGAPVREGQRRALAGSLARANAQRGPHSWGAYTVLKDEVEVAREVGSIAQVRGIGVLGLANTCLGHTRWATTGAVVTDNCHPFTLGDLTLAHNGMIHNHAELCAKYGRKDTARVDSMHLLFHLAEERPFSDLEGYGTITYVRAARPGDVHLCRMSGGELTAYGLGERSAPWGTVWSSNATHLREALADAKVPHFPWETLRENRVYLASADGTLYIMSADVTHKLADDRRSSWDRKRDRALTSGACEHGGAYTLTKREERMLSRAFASLDRANGTATRHDGKIVTIDLCEQEEHDAEAEALAQMDADAAAYMARQAMD